MIKRKPTRIELKLDDLDEFEAVKKEVEERRKQRNAELLGLGAQGEGAAETNGDASPPSGKTKADKINERIGYDPTPVPDATARVGTLPSPPPPPAAGQPPPR
ncbi:anaphase-promoting complex subunit CDC26-like [Branchiostoma floridae]|uniref:Anaphase-promoting complex subunit CDC26 n=1 Tax=Branchiostoma floridae TaxID=7739 RepID=A0A9J7LMB4_BRAFL|nr:anaphase-promoting complex subunit CDC26-like [Branchiostoma floridae]